jgi:hypothetical protein
MVVCVDTKRDDRRDQQHGGGHGPRQSPACVP